MATVMTRVMEIATPLGDGVLLFHGMHARDEMSRPSEYQLDLLSTYGDIDLDAILGKNVTVKLALPDDRVRYFNGYVTRFAQTGNYGRYHRYSATVRSWLWFLTRTADCRIFQEMPVPAIVKQVFDDHATADFDPQLTGTYRKRTYCVQYRETDLNFVSRLLEQEGIYYYFTHADGHHTMVLTDSSSRHTPVPGYETIPHIAPLRLARPNTEHIGSWSFEREVQPGVYMHDDFDLERPSVELRTRRALARAYSPSNYEVYDYPGNYVETALGEQYAAVRIDEFGSQFEVAHGTTSARGVTVGSLFALDQCPRPDQNREYVVLAASYEMEFSDYEGMPEGVDGGASFRCSFVAMPADQQFRPRRITPKPFVQGPQTAIVVGPPGDEIHTDKYGRVKVQFHWDRYGRKDANSSCWIRVSHPWAGKGWGAVATPRIGQEVIVDFLEGDPDQPIITGRVYNGENLPPFGFPAGAVVSGVKSDTHKGHGYNELAMDDTAGAELVRIHAQFDMDTVVEHDQRSTIHRNRTDRVDVDDAESVGRNQSCDVGVNQRITVGANRTKTVNASETATVMLQRTHTVGINETISVGAAQEITVGAMQAVTVGTDQLVNVGANQSTSVGSNQVIDVGANAAMSVGANEVRSVAAKRGTDIGADDVLTVGKNYVLDAGDSVTIRTGSASITMKKDGTIQIKGNDISIVGSGKINVKASSDVVVKGSKVGIN